MFRCANRHSWLYSVSTEKKFINNLMLNVGRWLAHLPRALCFCSMKRLYIQGIRLYNISSPKCAFSIERVFLFNSSYNFPLILFLTTRRLFLVRISLRSFPLCRADKVKNMTAIKKMRRRKYAEAGKSFFFANSQHISSYIYIYTNALSLSRLVWWMILSACNHCSKFPISETRSSVPTGRRCKIFQGRCLLRDIAYSKKGRK